MNYVLLTAFENELRIWEIFAITKMVKKKAIISSIETNTWALVLLGFISPKPAVVKTEML